MNINKISTLMVKFTEENKDKWNELDGAQGDGDLGVTMHLAAQALAESAERCNSVKEWLEVGGKQIRKAAPSTMGILIASALISAGRSIKDQQKELNLEDWITIQENMAAEIQQRGGAKLGDKTILDSFIPALHAFSDGVKRGDDLSQILNETTVIAKNSAEGTSSMISKIGRSSWLGKRSQGNIDGGAWVCYQIYDFISKINQDLKQNC
ncbi:hypothetical protein CVD28_18985 [Bacillus sp. M6-12]|uniref:dihydroxyacetone kinase subunit L n=1 Tax=Bacillus sp. M6-12 TaxID=2054166 RepID=UPI000C77D687|nr:dihydroxyacetone kinase subunit L [Bacillus sp. M6-12]PLS16126.1 hypothetical protein CVD28_18985 [Bacillus sp. M6-12]